MWARLPRTLFRYAFGALCLTDGMGRDVVVRVVVALGVVALLASGCGVLSRSDRGNVSGFPDDDLGVRVEVYKETPQRDLHLHVFAPESASAGSGAVLFFHGGGFATTRVEQFARQAQAAADAGMVGFVVEYRVTPEGTSRADAIGDGVDAVAYVAREAGRLGVDPSKIAVAGSSAGGALAVEASSEAAALALFNPAVGRGSASFLAGQPVIAFHSRQDTIVPFSSVEAFCDAAQNCTMVAFDQGDHGFFNDDPAFTETTDAFVEFLLARGW